MYSPSKFLNLKPVLQFKHNEGGALGVVDETVVTLDPMHLLQLISILVHGAQALVGVGLYYPTVVQGLATHFPVLHTGIILSLQSKQVGKGVIVGVGDPATIVILSLISH